MVTEQSGRWNGYEFHGGIWRQDTSLLTPTTQHSAPRGMAVGSIWFETCAREQDLFLSLLLV